MQLKINWDHKRTKHAIERMWLRGISSKDVINAIKKGQKRRQKENNLIEAFHSYYSIIYAEYFFKEQNIHKIYAVTVKTW